MLTTKTIRNTNKMVKSFTKKNIIVVGDIMLDKSFHGDIERISPEAPIPIVNVKKEINLPGGAANAALNIKELGANVSILGLVGDDDARDTLVELLENKGIDTNGLVIDYSYPTIQKTRVFSNNHLMIRYDYEDKNKANSENYKKLIVNFKNIIKKGCDAVLISDYLKGVCTKEFCMGIIEICNKNKIPIIVDSKQKDFSRFSNATLVKPNKHEAEKISGICTSNEKGIIQAGNKIVKDYNTNVLITCDKNGMYFFEKSKKQKIDFVYTPAKNVHVLDVNGAGDTVAATCVFWITTNKELANLKKISHLAVATAAKVITKVGTATISQKELNTILSNIK